ncbi:hypothetical protein, partial [Streptomyces griseofuscus]|uniref:hypothetical protein n=1 Tax=Streptomyces griseofuscus TaxID=146922 RepID=UPI001C0F2DA1
PLALFRVVLQNFLTAHRHCVAHILLSGRSKSNNFSPFFHPLRSIAQKPCNQAVLKAKRVNYQQRKRGSAMKSTIDKNQQAGRFVKKRETKRRIVRTEELNEGKSGQTIVASLQRARR